MRVTLSDARESPIAAAVFVVGAAVAAFAVVFETDDFGSPAGSPLWWVGIGVVAVAIVATVGWWLSTS